MTEFSFPDSLLAMVPAAWQPIMHRAITKSDANAPLGKSSAALFAFIRQEYLSAAQGGPPIYPAASQIFRALEMVPPDQLRVVLLGQDPYHGAGQAEGLSFSVPQGIKAPPSLRNMFKERESDLGIPAMAASPSLLPWAKQGVLLLNTTLTVRAAEAGSHRKHGWELLTDALLGELDERETPTVFLLWGADARKKKALLRNPRHLVLESEHPSPLSAYRGFFGSQPYSKANAYLCAHGIPAIDWTT